MVIENLIKLITSKLSDWYTIPAPKLIHFMDEVIFDINHQLNTQYPTFSEASDSTADNVTASYDYKAFPDEWQRTVVVYGAASKIYASDDEGINTATDYSSEYQEYLFLMLRDFVEHTEDADRAPKTGYFEDKWWLARGEWAITDWEDPM